MNKSQLVAALVEEVPCSKQQATDFLDAFEEVVSTTVKGGEAVMLTGFVKFERKDRPSRMGRNPATGETIKIAAKSVVKVTPLKKFKDSVMAAAPKKRAR
jgi:nucleoid DNA-binding protein